MKNSYFSALPIGTVSAVFFSKEEAKKTRDFLIKLGHADEEISMLMSDETLDSFQRPNNQGSLPMQEPSLSLQKLLSLYSNKFLAWLGIKKYGVQGVDPVLEATQAPDDIDTFSDDSILIDGQHQIVSPSIAEGGIIISVNPKNISEMDAIINEFRKNNGRDILGNDGYSKLD